MRIPLCKRRQSISDLSSRSLLPSHITKIYRPQFWPLVLSCNDVRALKKSGDVWEVALNYFGGSLPSCFLHFNWWLGACVSRWISWISSAGPLVRYFVQLPSFNRNLKQFYVINLSNCALRWDCFKSSVPCFVLQYVLTTLLFRIWQPRDPFFIELKVVFIIGSLSR